MSKLNTLGQMYVQLQLINVKAFQSVCVFQNVTSISCTRATTVNKRICPREEDLTKDTPSVRTRFRLIKWREKSFNDDCIPK